MKKLNSNGGFTLVELLAALLILVILIGGIGVGMNGGLRALRESSFEADSAALEDILNTCLGDILRHSRDVREDADTGQIVFTNLEYGVQDAYFDTSTGVVCIKNQKTAESWDLVNTGAYPELAVTGFEITYAAPGTEARGGCFTITYTIRSEKDPALSRDVEHVVRSLNP